MALPSIPFSPRTVVLFALGVLITLGLFLRHHLIAFLVIALIVIVAVMAVVMWLIARELKAAKAGKEIQGSLDKQVEDEIQRSTFGQQEEVRNLKAEWDAAIEELKRSAVGRRLGDKALAEMPMFLVIGPAGAGKTELIRESGLESLLRDASQKPRAVRGVGGARTFDWWFTDQAILLDMSGKTLRQTQFDDNDDWIGFLGSLRKQRPLRPINGVVVAIPVGEILDAPREKFEALTNSIRERTRDLSHHLGMEFPVYIVVTHCDTLAGFAETFAQFTPDQSAQVWGATIPVAKQRATPAEKLFEEEFAILMGSLSDLRASRVPALPDENQRMRALAFPAQLERLAPDLKRFLQVLFARGKDASGATIFRGFYFAASSTGKGTVEKVIGEAGERIGLRPSIEAPVPDVAKHAWFSNHLFRKIVFRDTALASASEFARQAEKRAFMILIGACVLAWALFTVPFIIFAVGAAGPVSGAGRAASDLRLIGEAPPREALPALEEMREHLVELEGAKDHKSLGQRLGAYSGDRVIGAAREFYLDRAVRYLVQPVARSVHDRLKADVVNASARFSDLFYEYQAYRLLADPHSEVEPSDSVVFGKVLMNAHRFEFERISPDSLRWYAALMRAQAACMAEHGEPHRPDAFGPFDDSLATAALATIRARWGERMQLYDDMILDANDGIRSLSLRSVLADDGRNAAEVLVNRDSVAGAFTLDGWTGFMRPRLAVMRAMVRRERDPQMQAQLGAQVNELVNEVATKYVGDYVSHWAVFLAGTGANPGASNGRRALEHEAGRGSEMALLLKRAVKEGDLQGEPEQVHEVKTRFEVLELWLAVPKLKFMERLTDPFRLSELHKTQFELFQGKLAKASKKEEGIRHSYYNQAFNAAMDWTSLENNSYVKHFDPSIASGARAVLTSLSGGGGGAGGLAGGAGGRGAGGGGAGGGPPADPMAFLNDWNSLIVASFTPLASKYPFSESGADATIDDFSSFFRPGGPLDQVFTKHLQGRLDPKTGAATAPLPSTMSPAMTAWIKKALLIREAMYPTGGADPKLAFDVKTNVSRLVPSTTLHSVTWKIGPSIFEYAMGEEESTTMEWSAATAGNGSSIQADNNGSPVAGPNFPGEWGLFHVLDAAVYTNQASSVLATWRFGTPRVTIQLEISPKKSVHPFSAGFLRLPAPPGN